jgi:heterodisulfide reductase subunit B
VFPKKAVDDSASLPENKRTAPGRSPSAAEHLDVCERPLESAYDFGAEMIVTPCPVCQMNVEIYQDQIN